MNPNSGGRNSGGSAPTTKKQGSSDEVVNINAQLGAVFVPAYQDRSVAAYKALLHCGVAPEQARIVLPLNTYTEWYWTGSLAAWARVCKLRLDPHAQLETREVAQQIADGMSGVFPVSWKALMGVG